MNTTHQHAEAGKKSEYRLARETEAAAVLRKSLAEFEDDEDLLRDTIEGQTSLHEMIATVLDSIEQDNEHVTGIGKRADDLGVRQQRLKKRIARKRALIEQAMAVGEIKTLELAEATVSLRRAPPKLVVENEADVPSSYWVAQDPKLDRKALTQALRDGDQVPGASLDNGGLSVTIRRA